MDFERIFPFIVLYIIWRIFFRARKKKFEVEKPDVGSDKADISVSPADVLKQMLFGGIEMPQTQTEEQEQMGDAVYEESLRYTPEEVVYATREEHAPIIPEEERTRHEPVQPEESAAEKQSEKRLKGFVGSYSGKDLQKAIVWSEVLAPPVGLRDT